MENKEDIVFSRNTVEFVTVAAEYCAYIERTNELQRKDFVGTMLKLLPLLYIKAQMLPVDHPLNDEELEAFVTEDSYEVIRITLADLFAQYDAYLDVFVAEMKYSVPGFNDFEAEDIAKKLSAFNNILSVDILPYHNFSSSKYQALDLIDTMPKIPTPNTEETENIKAIFRKYNLRVNN